MTPSHPTSGLRKDPEQGYMLVGLIVAIAIILLALSVAAPRMATSLRRDREVEAVHRGNQYVRAIQLYYRALKHYPGSLEQLEKTNNIRFLRQRYDDPITGKPDFRLIPVGQNQTTVKGFFGQPLAGIATAGLGSATGLASPGIGTNGASSPAGSFGATGASGTTGASGVSGASGTSGSSGGFGSQGASGFSGTGSPFMGVGLGTTGDSIVEPNEQTTYDSWEFLYDPRIEQLKAKAGLNGAGAGSIGATTIGTTPGAFGATGATGTPGTTAPFGSAPSTGTTTTPAP